MLRVQGFMPVQVVEEMDEGCHAFVPGGKVQLLIWPVEVVIGQGEAGQDRIQSPSVCLNINTARSHRPTFGRWVGFQRQFAAHPPSQELQEI